MASTVTAYEIPLIAISNQTLNVTLNGQNCTIHIYQRDERLYLDLMVGQNTIRQGAICIPYAPIITGSTSFSGQLYIADTLSPAASQETPYYDELGDRFKLYYLDAENVQIVENDKYEL